MTPPRLSEAGTPQETEPPAAVLSYELPTEAPAPLGLAPALPTAGTGSGGDAPETVAGTPGAGEGPAPETLRHRADFLKAAQGRKAGTGGFLLQARARGDAAAPRFGFTASKKIGNAVFRNRAKRRLRALAREFLAPVARAGWDYVLVAKPGATVVRDWALLQSDLAEAIARVHK